MRCGGPELCSECAADAYRARAALAQPSPAQDEQAEAERPEIVATLFTPNEKVHDYIGFKAFAVAGDCDKGGGEFYDPEKLMTVVQHERITAQLHDALDECDGERWKLRSERDAAQARVAELEKQEPVATIAKVPGEDWNGLHFYRDLQGMQPGTKLYAAPVAQAQQLHDLDKQCRDDVARALGLRPSQERGFAWSYLLASIKSCVKASEDTAQAQHSVPDELRAICMLVAETGIKYGRGRHRAVAADECRAVVNAVLDADLSVGRACEYAGCCDKAHPGTSLCIAHHSKKAQEKLLAAAPGKEGL